MTRRQQDHYHGFGIKMHSPNLAESVRYVKNPYSSLAKWRRGEGTLETLPEFHTSKRKRKR